MTRMHHIAFGGLLMASLASPAAAQNVTQTDVQRLQDNIYLADRDVTALRGRDATRATQLQAELDDLRDEVVYLKVKLRKERALTRSEYADVRDRIEDVRTRARGDSTARSAPAPSTAAAPTATSRSSTPARGRSEIPAGTEIDVRLSTNLNSGRAQVEDRFEGTTLVDLVIDGRTLVPTGSVVRGVVSSVEPGTRTNRTARMTVTFDQITIGARDYPIRGTVTQAIQGEGIKGETGRTAAGAGVGAIIGGILGGFKGALAGILIGGGGTIAATEGREVDLPQGAVLRMRIDSPVQLEGR